MFVKSLNTIHSINILLRKFVNRNTLFENDHYASTDTLVIVCCFGKTLWKLHTDKRAYFGLRFQRERVCRAEGSRAADGGAER